MSGHDPRLGAQQRQFFEHLGELGSTRLEPGYDQDEFFDDQFERRAHEIQQTPGPEGATNVIESKRGPWTGNNQLGIERHFAPDANNQQTVLRLDEWGFPKMWTLCLGLTFDPSQWTPVGTASFDITAFIDFGIGGVMQQVEIDWVNGACIALPMNAINVVAHYNLEVASEAGGPSEPPLDLRLRACVAHGVLSQIRPTRSFKVTSPVTLDLPPFARSMIILPNTSEGQIFAFYTQPGTVNFLTGTTLTPGFSLTSHLFTQFVEYLSVADSTLGKPVSVPVPTGARSVRIDGAAIGPFATTPIMVVFEIGV